MIIITMVKINAGFVSSAVSGYVDPKVWQLRGFATHRGAEYLSPKQG